MRCGCGLTPMSSTSTSTCRLKRTSRAQKRSPPAGRRAWLLGRLWIKLATSKGEEGGSMGAEENRDYVIQTCRQHDVKFIRLWFTDILGSLKSFSITVEELEGALEEGMGFDGSSIEGFARIDESDMVALPDPATFQLVPWRPQERGVARMFCDILQ